MSDHDTTPENTNTFPEIMTSEQAMAFLQMGRSAFYKALRAGEIPCRRINQRMIRFNRETLSTWIAGGAIPAAVEQAPPPAPEKRAAADTRHPDADHRRR